MAIEEWDEQTQTIPPERVTERALNAHDEYPNKRIIVHYMQPHFPFLGSTGESFEHAGIDSTADPDEHANPWLDLIPMGDVDPERVRRAYRENYSVVWNHVEELLAKVRGKVVITADHGNLIGERTWPIPIKTYGYPNGIRHPNLQRVPWVVVQSGDRRAIETGPPEQGGTFSEREVDDQLEALGYR